MAMSPAMAAFLFSGVGGGLCVSLSGVIVNMCAEVVCVCFPQ